MYYCLLKSVSYIYYITNIIFFISNTYASLSAETAQYIIGHEPEIPTATVEKIKENIYFTITDPLDFSYDYQPGTADQIYFPLGSQFKHITPKVIDIPLNNDDINDIDGDILSTYSISNISYVWVDKNNTIVSNDSSNTLGGTICENSSSYNGPYSLDVSFDMTVNTIYGVPNSATTKIEKNFTVQADDGICYIQPGVLALNIPNGWPEGNNNASAGSNSINRSPAFDSNIFVQNKGFIAWADKRFPTTAFPDARFQIVPYNSISNYNISIEKNPNSSLTDQQSYAKGQFKFSTLKPEQDALYVIKVVNSTTKVPYYYSFKLASSRSWFTFLSQPSTRPTYADALKTCNTLGADIPTKAELTNSIYANDSSTISMDAYAKNNGYLRTIGEGLTAEWGKIYYYSPSDGNRKDMMASVSSTDLTKNFYYSYYWTKDVPYTSVSTTRNYTVGSVEGNIQSTTKTSTGPYVLCIQ